MGTPSHRHPAHRHPARRRLEVLVLGAGLLSAAVMGYAALHAVEDPRASGQAALARLAGQVADGVVAEWGRLLRDPEPPAPPLGETFAWSAAEARTFAAGVAPSGAASAEASRAGDALPSAAAPDAGRTGPAQQAGVTAFDALLGEARRLEVLQSDAVQALATVQDALERAPDPVRRGAGRLRAIQLAVRAQRADVARAQWAAARAELDGRERTADAPVAPLAVDVAPPDCSLLLLCGLAVAPALDDAARAELCGDLGGRWRAGTLALPDAEDGLLFGTRAGPESVAGAGAPESAGNGAESETVASDAMVEPVTTVVPARREALRRRLLALAPAGNEDEAAWREDASRRRLAALARVLGGLPGAEPPPASDGSWQFDTRAALPFLWRAAADGGVRGQFTTWPAVRASLLASVERHALLPDGFLLDFGPQGDDAASDDTAGGDAGAAPADAPLVRERIALCGDAFGFALRHRDPAAVVGDETRRAAWLRGGLLVLAALAALATLLTARALRRERALAALRSAFIAGVSHELRTPVSSILLLADNLEAGRVRGEAPLQRYHALIRREALRLRRLVDDVLDMSRLERGESVRLQLADVALPAFVDDVAAEARELVERAGGRFTFEVSTGGAALPAAATLDAEAVRRAVLNLVDNALRHSGSRDIALEARLDVAATRQPELVLRVRDAGHGIPPREHERIFEPFERLTPRGAAGAGRREAARSAQPTGPSATLNTPSTPGASSAPSPPSALMMGGASAAPGAGLGLAIVRAIARGHGGEARVVDLPPAGAGGAPGACFEIRLPLGGLDGEAPAVDRALGRHA